MPKLRPLSEGSEPAQQSAGTVLLPNPAYVRMWKLVAGFFLLVGLLALTERLLTLTLDIHARRTWPVAEGSIVHASLQDDTQLSNRAGSIRGRTRYWVEYEVSFAVPMERCRTGLIYEGPGEVMPCHGIVRTRSTQSAAEASAWLRNGYHVNQFVQVLWNPEGTASTDIKIAGQPIGRGYNFGRLTIAILWVIGFGAVYVFMQRRLTTTAPTPG